MKHSAAEIYQLLPISESVEFPVRALMAGIAAAESHGDPNAWVPHDPPTSLRGAPSSGLYQVHQSAWPSLYNETERIRHSSLSDEEKIVQMTRVAEPIIRSMLTSALEAEHILASRGVRTSLLNTALFVDAAWQTGGHHLIAWAKRTTTGDPREIVNAKRTIDVEVALRNLASAALDSAPAIMVAVGVLAGLGIAAFLLSRIGAD